jgi:hypothetical protein
MTTEKRSQQRHEYYERTKPEKKLCVKCGDFPASGHNALCRLCRKEKRATQSAESAKRAFVPRKCANPECKIIITEGSRQKKYCGRPCLTRVKTVERYKKYHDDENAMPAKRPTGDVKCGYRKCEIIIQQKPNTPHPLRFCCRAHCKLEWSASEKDKKDALLATVKESAPVVKKPTVAEQVERGATVTASIDSRPLWFLKICYFHRPELITEKERDFVRKQLSVKRRNPSGFVLA